MVAAQRPPDDSPEAEGSVGLLLSQISQIDATAEQLQASLRLLRECIDAGVACVRAAQVLIQEHSTWREVVSRDSAKTKLGTASLERIATLTAAADERALQLQDSYAECARPLQASVEAQAAQLEKLDGRRHELVQRLPGELAARHKLLREGNRYPYICSVVRGRCDACNLQLPTLLAQQLGQGRSDSCPSCKRILCGELLARR